MIEHDVQNHFDASIVKRIDHLPAFQNGVAAQIVLMWREKTQRVVAPVIDQALVMQELLADVTLHRHQLHAGDAQRLQIGQHLIIAHARESPALLRGDAGVIDCETPQMGLVEHALCHGDARPARGAHGNVRYHDTLGHEGLVVALVELQLLVRMRDVEGVMGVRPLKAAAQLAAVRVQRKLVGIEAVAHVNLPRPVHAVGVHRAGAGLGQIAMPHLIGDFRQFQPLQLAGTVGREQTQLHALRIGREQSEVHTLAIPGGTQGIRRSRNQSNSMFHVFSVCTNRTVARGGTLRRSDQGRP